MRGVLFVVCSLQRLRGSVHFLSTALLSSSILT
jgi:hypothetical protein